MSEEEKPLEFSARDLMPDWAQEQPREARNDLAKRYGDDDRRDRRGERRDDRGGFGGRGERRGPGGGGGGGRFERDRQRDDRPRGGGPRGDGPRGDGPRGDGPRGGGPRDERPRGDRPRQEGERGDRREGGRPGRDFRDGRDRREGFRDDLPAPGITAAIEPSGPAIEGLTRHIRETFRSFALADLAKMILEARERYRIRFTAAEPVKLYQCLADASLWLSREEAVSHVLSGPALEHFYTSEDVSVDPPAGNFSVIAVCGLSGVILGPPNHHEYQRNIARLHRERFSDMSLERFKSRIRMESGEEILEKWKEQVSRVRQYRVKSADQPSPVEPAVPETTTEEAAAESGSAAEETIPGEATAESEEVAAGDVPEVEEEVAVAASEAPAPAAAKSEDGLVLKSHEEVARHFRQHFADDAVVETSIAVVPGNVPGRQLSPGLLAHLKLETERLRRGFPLALIQSLCHEFEQKGLKFFKRGKKSLHVSAVRPKAIDESATLTEQIQRIVDFVSSHARPTVAALLEAMVSGFKMPQGPLPDRNPDLSEEAKSVLGDLRWLTAEGYVLEFPDTSLAIGRMKQVAPVPPAPSAETPKKKRKETKERETKVAAPAAAMGEEAGAPVPDHRPNGTEDEFPGDSLVALSGEEADPSDPSELPESVDPVETF